MLKPNLLATKLHRPSIPAKWVPRPHLIQRLNEGLGRDRQVTLVSAPAGFGKTTCVSEWLNTLDRWPVTWLSLDPSDDDPGRFFAYFLAALQKLGPDLGHEIEGVMRSGQLPPAEIISTTLINDILKLDGRFLLVLDDLQVIQDRFILQVLENLVTNPPQPLHLVLLTREDPPLPLARLRANNLLTEIRARDLRFASRDADRFLNEVMGLSLSQADIAALEDKTEGWIAGLQLAAIAMGSSRQSSRLPRSSPSAPDRASPSPFIANLSGSHRFILSYLTEQVLSRQPQEIQGFLLQTSILDRLNSDLCNAVTGRSDSHALLERSFNANLFLVPLDDEGQWYRYHHLFADLLRDLQDTLHKDKTAALHQRASHWYAQAGMVSEAIQHALAGEDFAMAVNLLENHAMGMIMQGYAKTVNAWVGAIPEGWASQSPRTNLAFAWMHVLRGAYSQAVPYLERLEGTFSDSQVSAEDRRSLKAEWLVMQSLLLSREGKTTESLALAGEALEIAPQEDSRVRSLACFGLACAYQEMDDYDRVVDAYQRAIQHGRAAQNPIVEMLSTSGLARLAFEHGQLHLAFEIAAPVSARVEASGSPPPISTVVFGILGEIYCQWYQTEPARSYILRALRLSTLGGYNSGMTGCRVLLSRLSQLEGDLETAAREIQKAIDLMQAETPDYVRQEAVSQQVCLYLARGRPGAAEMALQGQGFSFREGFSFPDLPSGQRISHSIGLLYNSGLRLLLYQARAGRNLAGLSSGIDLADQLVARALRSRHIIVALGALLLRAQMRAALGDQRASREDYAKALELGEAEGFIGVFIEGEPPVAEALADLVKRNQLGTVQPGYVKGILAAFSGSGLPGAPHDEQPAPDLPPASGPVALVEPETPVEPLTDRELEVLGLMAEGLKYKEIAARLFISLNTVRFHVKAIYGKLNVNNRTGAIQMARQRRIL
ncbi:MAG: LuxR C-terminal-related transcriptional regulator [Anaerolineales bacterium]